LGIGALVLSVFIRKHLNIEWNIASIREFVEGLGIWGQLVFMGILTFRFIFLIPTGLLLLVAGLVFGPIYGTLYAGLGMTGSGMIKYAFASVVGRDVLIKQMPIPLQLWIKKVSDKKMSIWALGGVCAYPFFPKHVFQLAAVLSGMSLAAYITSIAAGGIIRAAIFCNIGDAIYTGAGLMTASGALLVGMVLPMCVPSWRHWMLAPISTKTTNPPSTEKLS